jgi:DNA-binding NtrC family response regulator
MQRTQEKNNGSAIRILHVGRDKEFLLIAKEVLKTFADFKIDIACSFVDAHKALEMKQYDVIISGYSSNTKERGLDFFKELKAKGSEIPFIMFSLHDEIKNESLKLGVTKFIDKNGDCEKTYVDLSNSIKEICKR